MVLLFLILMSLSAIYFTRLLSNKRMRIAAIATSVVYFYLVAWIYAIFIIDIADLGFSESETQLTLLHGSNIYHSFVQLTAKMSAISLPLLQVIVGVSLLVLVTSFAVIFHGIFEISKEIIFLIRKNGHKLRKALDIKIISIKMSIRRVSIIRLYCRANC